MKYQNPILLLLLIFNLLSCENINSQLKGSIGFKIGVSSTLDDSKYHGSYDQNMDLLPLYGLNIQIFLDKHFLPNFSLYLNSEFDQKGYFPEYIVDTYGNLLSINAKTFDILSFGIGIKSNFYIKNNFNVFFLTGVRGEFVLDKTNFVINDFNNFLTGLTIGAGIEYNVKKIGALLLDFEFKPDLSVHDKNKGIKYRTIEIKTGLGFPI